MCGKMAMKFKFGKMASAELRNGHPHINTQRSIKMAVGQNEGIPFWLVGEFTTRFRTYFSGDWDVHYVLTRGQSHTHTHAKATILAKGHVPDW